MQPLFFTFLECLMLPIRPPPSCVSKVDSSEPVCPSLLINTDPVETWNGAVDEFNIGTQLQVSICNLKVLGLDGHRILRRGGVHRKKTEGIVDNITRHETRSDNLS